MVKTNTLRYFNLLSFALCLSFLYLHTQCHVCYILKGMQSNNTSRSSKAIHNVHAMSVVYEHILRTIQVQVYETSFIEIDKRENVLLLLFDLVCTKIDWHAMSNFH